MTPTPEPTTLRSSLPLFAAWLQDRDRSARTVQAYGNALARFADWLEQYHPTTTMQEVTIRDGTLFRDALQAGGRSAATINQLLAACQCR